MIRCFNPRAHAGRDTAMLKITDGHFRFNPRAHAGRDEEMGKAGNSAKSFNPRAHAGRDDLRHHREPQSALVSIHAPTRGATLFPEVR